MAAFLQLVNGLPTSVNVAIGAVYDESIYYSSGLASGTDITLPNSGSFADPDAKDLIVILNNRVVEVGRDFTVLGAGPSYTQIEFIYDLPDDAVLRFRYNV